MCPYIHFHLCPAPKYVSFTGVEKNNDDAKHNFYSSNRQDPCGEILRTEKRLEHLDTACRREKRKYTKRDHSYWTGGIIETRAAKRARTFT